MLHSLLGIVLKDKWQINLVSLCMLIKITTARFDSKNFFKVMFSNLISADSNNLVVGISVFEPGKKK
jgi:hypothetical protein